MLIVLPYDEKLSRSEDSSNDPEKHHIEASGGLEHLNALRNLELKARALRLRARKPREDDCRRLTEAVVEAQNLGDPELPNFTSTRSKPP